MLSSRRGRANTRREARAAINQVSLTQKQVLSLPIPLPPLTEQRRIAEILDAADESIRQSERVIAKLRDVKKGLLHDLLTRGLDADGNLRDPDVHTEQFKDSPLGRIPRDWKTVSIDECLQSGDIVEVQDGNHGERHPKSADFVSEGIPFIMAKDLSGGGINTQTCHRITREQYKSLRVGFAKTGDVLLTHKGTIGLTALVPGSLPELMLTPQVTYYRVADNGGLLAGFLLWFFRTQVFQHRLAVLSAQSTRAYVGITAQKTFAVAVPPVDEQNHIVAILDAHDARIRAEEATLDKLRQVKRGLMDDLLTGRVRG